MVKAIIKLIAELTYCAQTQSCDHQCQACELRLTKGVLAFIKHQQPIVLVLPAFPAKSGNRDKTLSALPDLGEQLAIARLNQMAAKISAIYKPGAKVIICSDGHVFSDIVQVSDQAVDEYQQAIKQLCQNKQYQHIQFFDLYDYYGQKTLPEIRAQLTENFGQSVSEIRQQVQQVEDEKKLFNGLHRFLYEDLKYFYPSKSRSAIQKLAKDKAYLTIQRSHAWSQLVANQFSYSIRLSIHPHDCHSNKITVQLIKSKNPWATPWHNVVVKTACGIQLLKKAQAIKLGAKLKSANTMDAHYAL